MSWTKTEVELQNIPAVIMQFQGMIKNGDDNIEKLRCYYKLENEVICHLSTVFDFLDNFPEEKIVKFSVYQIVE